jgi:hypothetical protein
VTSKLFKWTGLSGSTACSAALFGLVRGALIAVIMIAVLLAFTPRPMPNWMVKSQVLPYAMEAECDRFAAPNAIKTPYAKVCWSFAAWNQQDQGREQLRALRRGVTRPAERPAERQKGKVRDLLIFDLDGTLIDSKKTWSTPSTPCSPGSIATLCLTMWSRLTSAMALRCW